MHLSLTMTLRTNVIPKSRATEVAQITAGSVRSCSSSIGVNSGVVLTPARLEYVWFLGSLPAISSIRLTTSLSSFGIESMRSVES